MPLPIVPAPTTPTVLIVLMVVPANVRAIAAAGAAGTRALSPGDRGALRRAADAIGQSAATTSDG
jgi:hypothetical protein